MTQPQQVTAPVPSPERLAQVGACRTCAAFTRASTAVSALADVDAIPASIFFKMNDLLAPGRTEHMRRFHPDLWKYERQAAAARAAALGMPQ